MPGPQKLTLEALHLIDNGKLSAEFDACLRQLEQDLHDRPHDSSARTVTLKLELTPTMDQRSGQLQHSNIKFSVDTKVPKIQTNKMPLGLNRQGGFSYFHPESPDDPHQPAFPFEAENAGGEQVDTDTGEVRGDDDDGEDGGGQVAGRLG